MWPHVSGGVVVRTWTARACPRARAWKAQPSCPVTSTGQPLTAGLTVQGKPEGSAPLAVTPRAVPAPSFETAMRKPSGSPPIARKTSELIETASEGQLTRMLAGFEIGLLAFVELAVAVFA